MSDDDIALRVKPGFVDELRERQGNVEDATAILAAVKRKRDLEHPLEKCQNCHVYSTAYGEGYPCPTCGEPPPPFA